MRSHFEICMFHHWHACLAPRRVHRLQLGRSKLLNGILYYRDNVVMCLQVISEWGEANHIKGARCLKRPVDMVVFIRNLGLIKIRRHASVLVRLGLEKVRV